MCVRPDAESWRQYKQLFETKLRIKPGNIGIKITPKRIATIYFWSNQLNEIRIYNDCFSSHTYRSPVIKNNSETKHEKRMKYPVLVRVLQRNRTNRMTNRLKTQEKPMFQFAFKDKKKVDVLVQRPNSQ